MFGSIGGAEILMVLVLALLLFGPRRLPQIGRTIGRAMSEFRKATNDLRSSLEHEVHSEELKNAGSELSSVRRDLTRAARDVNPIDLAKDALLHDPAQHEPVSSAPRKNPDDAEPDAAPARSDSEPAEGPADVDDGQDGRT